MSTTRRPTQRGFTLLEVLVATAILGVAVVTLLGLHARNLALSSEAQELTIAGTLAGDVLTQARLEPSLDLGTTHGRFVARATAADGQSSIYGGPASAGYEWSRDVLATALPTLHQVRVRVTRSGEEHVLAEFWAALSVKTPGAN